MNKCIWCCSDNIKFEPNYEYFDAELDKDVIADIHVCEDCGCIHLPDGSFQIDAGKEVEYKLTNYIPN